MSIYHLPKSLNTDFSKPLVKPKHGVTLDLSNDLTKNLVLAVEMTEGAGAPLDLVTKKHLSENGQGWSISGGDRETTYTAAGDDSVDISGLSNFSGNAHTLHLRVRVSAYDSSGTVIFGWNNNGSHFWQVDDVSTTVFIAGSQLNTTSSAHEGATNNYRDWFFVSDPVAGESRFYENGVLLNTKNVSITIPSGSKDVKIGRWAGSNNFSLEGGIKFCRAWNRALTEAERISLLNDPYQILKPDTPQVYFAPEAGGAFTLSADSGTYTVSGTAVTLAASKIMAADSGTYTYTGTASALNRGFSLTADSGTYTYTGTAANLTFASSGSFTLSVDSGAYTYSGTSADLKLSAKLNADSGSYTYTGTAVTLTKGFTLTANSGSYTYTGTAVDFSRNYVIGAESGIYSYNGSIASLIFAGIPPDIPVAVGVTVSSSLGDGVSLSATFGSGATVKGNL